MPDSAEQLQRIYAAGFDVVMHERYPQCVAVSRGNCAALLQVSPQGLSMLGLPGWRMGDLFGVLVEKDGCAVFQWKSETVQATPERQSELQQFRTDLQQLLMPAA
ncbi:MAG TPA: hypothetical protein VMU24_10345 [Candidatus Acidoferrales bacterium]|jgi:hypothetical protein|nr:hypothetical protein [Candidatus Acidoferrales bacterium]